MEKQEIGINIMTNESLQVPPDNKGAVLIGHESVTGENSSVKQPGKDCISWNIQNH